MIKRISDAELAQVNVTLSHTFFLFQQLESGAQISKYFLSFTLGYSCTLGHGRTCIFSECMLWTLVFL